MQFCVNIHARSPSAQTGIAAVGGMQFRCVLGRGGRQALKIEGDGATPVGSWPLRQVLYRRDRVRRPLTLLPVRPISPHEGWCDDPRDRNYNRLVPLPYPASHERLWRDDHLYDLVVVLGYNHCPRVRRRGSAIFMHLAAPDFTPTEGCIALHEADLRKVLAIAGPASVVRVRA